MTTYNDNVQRRYTARGATVGPNPHLVELGHLDLELSHPFLELRSLHLAAPITIAAPTKHIGYSSQHGAREERRTAFKNWVQPTGQNQPWAVEAWSAHTLGEDSAEARSRRVPTSPSLVGRRTACTDREGRAPAHEVRWGHVASTDIDLPGVRLGSSTTWYFTRGAQLQVN